MFYFFILNQDYFQNIFDQIENNNHFEGNKLNNANVNKITNNIKMYSPATV